MYSSQQLLEWFNSIRKWQEVAGFEYKQDEYSLHKYQFRCMALINEEQQELARANSDEEFYDAVADVLVTKLGGLGLNFPTSTINSDTIGTLSIHFSIPGIDTFLAWVHILGGDHDKVKAYMEEVIKSNWTKFKKIDKEEDKSSLEEIQKLNPDITHITYNQGYEICWKGEKIAKHPLTYKAPFQKD